MRPKPNGWDQAWNAPDGILLLKLTVYLNANVTVVFTQDDLESCTLEGSLFKDLSIGNACSARLRFVLKNAKSLFTVFANDQKIIFEVSAKGNRYTTAYVPQGTFYIDSVDLSNDNDVVIVAYDELYRLAKKKVTKTRLGHWYDWFSAYMQDGIKYQHSSSFSAEIINRQTIADKTDISVAATSLEIRYIVVKEAAADVESREVFQTVAAFAGGNIALDKDNAMRLYRLDSGATITAEPAGLVVTASSLTRDEDLQVISGVDLIGEDETYSSASGWRLPAKINENVVIAASEEAAAIVDKNMRTDSDIIRASNIRADGVLVSPLFELGDIISVDLGNGEYYNFAVCDYSVSYTGGCWGYLGVPKSSDAISYSINNAWDTDEGWTYGWTNVNLRTITATFGIRVLNKYQFRLTSPVTVAVVSGTSYSDRHVANISIEPFDVTISYYSTVDNQLKSVTVTASLDTDIYPLEHVGEYWGLQNVAFFCSGLPDDAIGAQISGNPVKLKRPSSSTSGYQPVSFKLSNN